ncbi:MAG TPA: hypothetical protein VFQ13_15395 [Anaerolineales bacterium]|nr:hypothetical protein [Anaerolineales bacterium]
MNMNKPRIRTYGSEALSLLTLRIVLIDARRDVPPSVSKNDMNEELAAKLIRRMKSQYKKYLRLIA